MYDASNNLLNTAVVNYSGGALLWSGWQSDTPVKRVEFNGTFPVVDSLQATLAPFPEIALEGNSVNIADGDSTPTTADHTDFGGVPTVGGTVTRTFTVRNTGNAVLNLTGTPKVTVSGAHAADFTVSVQPASPVASGGGTTTFEVIFNPNGDGLRSATLSLANSDSDENPFDFAIRGTGLNLAPAAGDDTYSVAEDTTLTVTAPGVLGNDSDPESGTLTVAPATPPAHGALTLHADGGFYYTPSPNYFGPDSFTYLVSDPAGNTATATANLTVVPVNDPTILAADAAGVTVDEGSSATMTGTFSDVEGNESIVFTASVGTIRQDNLAGTWSWTHTPTEGPSSIQVLLTAHDGGNPPVTTSFAVDVRNVPPSFDLGPAVTVPLSANGQFSVDQVTINDPGEDMWSVHINYGDGSPTEQVPPNPGVRAFSLWHRYAARGSYTVTVDVSDGLTSATDTAQVTVLLNSAPVADAGGPYTLDAGSPLALDGSGTDPDTGDSLTFAWDLNNDGTFDDANGATPTVPPAALAALGLRNGAHPIRLRVSDGAGASATSSTTLTIRGTQTIAFSAIGDHVFGEAPFTISATASSGLPVTFTSLTPGVVTVSGNTVTLVAAGTATLRASQAGDATWQEAPDTELSFRVAKATPLAAWAKPADINCLTPLGPAQLAATANLPGLFTYTPAAGGQLPPGDGQTLTAVFTPTDTANYESVSITAKIDVRVDAVGELWARRFGGDDNDQPDEATSMRVDADGNVVAAGKIFIGGRTHSYTAKYSAASGSLFWERIYGGPDNQYDAATALALDREGNALVTGVSWSTSGYADIYTAKYAAATGAVLWERRYDGPTHSTDEPAAVVVDSNGDVVVTGASEFDFYTAKYAGTDGALLWERRYNGPGRSYDQPTALAADAAGNVIVTGYSQGTGSRPDYYTAKYAAADGALLWERRYEGPGRWWDQPTAVAVDANGDVVVTGFSSGDGTQTDYYTAKYAAADGAIIWESRFDGPGYLDPMLGILSQDEATALGLDSKGNVLVTGRSTDTLGNLEFCTLKYGSADGALIWEKRYHGPASDPTDDEPAALVADGQGNVIVTGRSRAPGPSGNSDFYAAKYAAADGALLWEKRYNAAYDRSAWASARALALLPNGDVILAGSVRIGADASDMLTVRLRPTPEPVVALVGPASLSIDLNGVFDDPGATATDACGVALPVTIAGTLDVHAAGTYALTYLATDVVGRSSQVTRRITVHQGQQTISFAPIIGRSYGGAPFSIAASASSGLPVTFTSLTPTVVVNGDRVTILAAGDATIRASQAGNADYQPAAYVDRTFTVAKAAPEITWPTPSPITSSTPLSDSELNATADTAGSFAYFPSAGTRVPRGLQTLSATFTPTDSGNFAVAMKTVSLTVLNSPPWASPQSVTGVEDAILPIALAGTDVDADPLTFTVVNGPAHGTLSGTAPDLTYIPAENFNGTDSLTYAVNDGAGDSAPATVLITVTPVNDVPVAIGQSLTTHDNESLPIALAGTDAENTSLTYRIATGPTAGRLSGTPPNLVYTPPFPFAGKASFTYDVQDADGAIASATVSITVVPSDRPPVAAAGADQSVVAGPDCQATVNVDGRGSTDPDGDAISFRWELRQSGQVLDTVTGQAVASWSLPPGNYEAVLTVSTDKSGTLVRSSDSLAIEVLAGAPVLTALSPASAYAGGAGFNLAVTGGCFLPGAVVQWNGAPRPTTVVDGSRLTAAIPAADLQTGAPISVATVRVIDGDGQISGPLGFSIVAPTVGVADAAVAQPGQATSASTAPTVPGEPGVSITVQNSGSGPVSVLAATYDAKPVGETAFRVDNGAFVDVQVNGANPNVAATVYFYYPSGATGPAENRVKLRYFDGANWIPVLSRGGLSPVKDTTDNLDGTVSGGRFSVVFDMTSTPRITDLAGTVFGMFESEPQLRPITGPAGPVALGNAVGITVSFAIVGDPADAAVRFIWDDGTESIMAPTSATSGTATHLYATPGVYGLTVQVMDAAGDVSEGRFEYVVIYDPNGGFVTGGGWLESPAGAYLYDAALTGRATFGFNSKYLKGQSVPTGQTQFQFQAGDFKFHSTAYEWLVVSGAKAQYRGVGQVNGAGDYGFLLTATDGQVGGGGGVDKFRIKIWNLASHAILYDNRRGTSDDLDRADPQAIGGGSIVIQKGK